MSKVFVFDTNALISATLIKSSTNALAISHAIRIGRIALSPQTMDEFTSVIFRKKFDRYFIDDSERFELIETIGNQILFITPTETVQACRDPKDDKFLELAIAADASAIITGDQDLLILHPFAAIPILSATDFLSQF